MYNVWFPLLWTMLCNTVLHAGIVHHVKNFENVPEGIAAHLVIVMQPLGSKKDEFGNGFIINGRILTNQHVTLGSKVVTIKFYDGTEQQGTVSEEDTTLDIATVDVKNMPQTLAHGTLHFDTMKVIDMPLTRNLELLQLSYLFDKNSERDDVVFRPFNYYCSKGKVTDPLTSNNWKWCTHVSMWSRQGHSGSPILVRTLTGEYAVVGMERGVTNNSIQDSLVIPAKLFKDFATQKEVSLAKK